MNSFGKKCGSHKLTNSKFLIPISLQPAGVNFRYFKLRLFDLTELIVRNILVLRQRD